MPTHCDVSVLDSKIATNAEMAQVVVMGTPLARTPRAHSSASAWKVMLATDTNVKVTDHWYVIIHQHGRHA